MNPKKYFLSFYLGLLAFLNCSIQALDNEFKPVISILTSVWKGDEFIEHFLIDITRQTIFDQCELIIINANSPGNEEEIIKKYVRAYPNIIYKRLDKDPGLYGVWNLAIGISRAEFLVNANIDDRMAPNFLEVHLQALQENPDVDLVYCDNYWTGKPNETFETNSGNNRFHPLGYPTPEFSKAIAALLPGCHPMWRKSLHKKCGLFDETVFVVGDLDMWMRAVKAGAIFKKINGIYGLYYSNPIGLSTSGFELIDNQHVLTQQMSPEARARHDRIIREFTLMKKKHPEFIFMLEFAAKSQGRSSRTLTKHLISDKDQWDCYLTQYLAKITK
jgi:GT2 family glycosyltransferase